MGWRPAVSSGQSWPSVAGFSICRNAGGAPFWLLDRSPRPVRETIPAALATSGASAAQRRRWRCAYCWSGLELLPGSGTNLRAPAEDTHGKCVVSICRNAGGAPFWLLDRSPRPVRETYTGRFGNQRRERSPTSPLALRLLLVRPGPTSRQRHEPPGACRRHAPSFNYGAQH
jgi:hypothetical protein